jgi:YVTN family beta-propeller protein
VEFRWLGLLEISGARHDGEPPAGKERALLGVLLLHANQPVSTDELAAELWGDAPPAHATKNVQTYVSRARRLLGDGRIATTPAGYVMRVEPGELDAERFEELAATGTAALAGGDAAKAERTLTEALGLWRGPALADFRFESFAQAEIRRLESLRDAATADRLEAVLARSPAQAIPELEAVIAAKPLWERPRALLMLALYRVGRQSEALELYRSTRALFDSELGIEPSRELQNLERAILNQDPGLDPPVVAEGPPPEPPRRRRLLPVLAAGGLLVTVGAAALVFAFGGSGRSAVTVRPDSVALLDPSSGRLLKQAQLPGSPSQVALVAGRLWVWGDASHTLSELDPSKLTLRRELSPGGFADQLAAGAGALWLVDGTTRRLVAIDPAYAGVASRTGLPGPRGQAVVRALQAGPNEDLTAVRTALTPRDAWVTDGGTGVDEIRLSGPIPRLTRRIDLGAPLNGIAAGEGAVWALSGATASVFELDPATGKVRTRILLASKPSLVSPFPVGVAAGLGSVWVLNGNTARVTRIDPGDGSVTATIALPLDSEPVSLVAGAGAVWSADSGDGQVSRIDPATNAVTSIHVGGAPFGVAVAGRTVAVTVQPSLGNAEVAPAATLNPVAAATLGALPTSFCSPVYYDGRHLPRLLIAADLPLQGYGNLAQTLQMSDAIRYELARAHFRAGAFSVGYQLCDDSSVQYDAWSPETCSRNAHAFAARPRVVGILGPFNSGCAEKEIPIAESSPSGPLPLISSTATYVGLTRGGSGTSKGEPAVYYPHHVRNFVRVVANDAAQGMADAEVAKKLGVRSLWLLEDGNAYGLGVAAAVGANARPLGIRVAGESTWGSTRPALRSLALRIKRSGADGVFIGGTIDEDGNALVSALRAALGPGEQIVTPDGFTPVQALISSGPAAEGVTVSIAEIDPGRLTGAGAVFAKGFSAATGSTVEPYSAAAAQATDTLLSAIARSDGTRASVNAKLHATRTVDGILGSFSFDRAGDTTAGIVTVYRIEKGRAVIWRVFQPA